MLRSPTLIAKTVTQMAADNPETTAWSNTTPKPAEQDRYQPPTDTPGEPVPTSTATLPYPFIHPTETGTPTTTGTGEPSVDPSPETATTGTPQATPTEEDTLEAGVPGLNPVALAEQLVNIGFGCSPPQILEGQIILGCSYETTDFLYTVSIRGSNPDTVDLIEAVAIYFGELDYTELTSIIFELIVETTYSGEIPDEAGEWIIETLPEIQVLGDEFNSIFWGVRYHLFAFPAAHVLEIGDI